MSLLLRRAAAQSTAARAGVTLVRSTSVAQRRCYQGNLQDKDRIFTNLYNDTSPYLKDAKKRVRLCTLAGGIPSPWLPSLRLMLPPARRPPPPAAELSSNAYRVRRATGIKPRSSCCWGRSRSSLT